MSFADKRIVLLTDSGAIPSLYVRFVDPIALATHNYNVAVTHGPEAARMAADADLLVAHRWFGPEIAKLVDAARARGVPIVYETDDNLLDLAEGSRIALPAQVTAAIEHVARAADLVICSTAPLAAALERFNDRIVVIENYGLPKPAVDPGGEPHLAVANTDYFKLGETRGAFFDAIGAAIERHGYRVTFFGSVDPAMASLRDRHPDRVTIVASLLDDRSVFLDRLYGHGVNVAAVPLEHSRQHSYKSDIKYLDFASIGVPGVFNNRAVYGRVRHGLDGWLCDDGYEGWLGGFAHFASAANRRAAGEAARAVAAGPRSIENYADRFARCCAGLLGVPPAGEEQAMVTQATGEPTGPGLYWDGGELWVRQADRRRRVAEPALIPALVATGLGYVDPTPAERAATLDGAPLTVPDQLRGLDLGRAARPAPRPPASGPALRIAWIVPGLIIGGGGHRNIIRCAYQLERLGHQVSIHFIDTPVSGERNRQLVREHFYPFDGHVGLLDERIAGADILFATHWSTVRHAEAFADRVGEIVYFVQDFEPHFYPMGSEYVLAEATYRKGFYAITSGIWCEQFLRERFGSEADHFQFPIDRDIYTGDDFGERRNRVLFFAKPEMGRRCYEIGELALARFHRLRPGVEIAFYGSPDAIGRDPDFPVTQLGVLPGPRDLARLYGTSKVGLVFSTTNPSLVPYEMMACGLPVLDLARPGNELNYGGRLDVARLADPEPAAMAAALAALVDDPAELAARGRAGLRFAAGFPVEEDVGRRIEALLLRRVAGWDDARRGRFAR